MAGVPRNLTLEQAHNERRDREILELREQIANLTTLIQGLGRERKHV